MELQLLRNEFSKLQEEFKQQDEVIASIAKEKGELEKRLAPQTERNKLKAQALEALDNGDLNKAEQYLRTSAQESIEETAETFYQLGKIKKLQLQFSEALKYFDLAATIQPENTLYLIGAGQIYFDAGYHEKAMSYFEKSLTIEKKHDGEEDLTISILYTHIGSVNLEMGEVDKAIFYYNKALDISNKLMSEDDNLRSTIYNNLGLAYHSKALYDKAIIYYKKVSDIEKKIMERRVKAWQHIILI